MKKIIASALVWITISIFVLNIYSCGKEEITPPAISFNVPDGATADIYLERDTSLSRGKIFNVGVAASRTGLEDILTSCKISKSVNGGADSTIQEMNFIAQSFLQYFSYQAPDSGVSERYTFTIGEKDGLTSSINITVAGI